jgi:hypothetical protein
MKEHDPEVMMQAIAEVAKAHVRAVEPLLVALAEVLEAQLWIAPAWC